MFFPWPMSPAEAEAFGEALKPLMAGQPPVEAVYPPAASEPIPESEEERKQRMWRAVVESCGRSK